MISHCIVLLYTHFLTHARSNHQRDLTTNAVAAANDLILKGRRLVRHRLTSGRLRQ